jgi:uncharacterized membrane-anchored protein
MPTWLMGILVVLVSVLLAVAGLYLVRRLLPRTFLASPIEATYTTHQAIAMVYGVAVGFAIFLSWEQLNTAQVTTQREASNLEAIYRLAQQLPESDRNHIQELAQSYARVVIDEEWPLLARGQASSHAQSTADELQQSIQKFEPTTMTQEALYTQMLAKVGELEENREQRLLESQEGVPPLMWSFLVIIGIITVAFTYLFGIESPRQHILIVMALTVVVALSLYTVRVIEYPFVGDVQVRPDAFKITPISSE